MSLSTQATKEIKMTNNELTVWKLTKELEASDAKRKAIKAVYTAENDHPELDRTYTYRGNKF
jgi:hypothetical protein